MNRFVLFMDVLGFSNLVEENSPDEIKQIYDSEFRQTADMAPLFASTVFGRPMALIGIESIGSRLHDVRQNAINLHLMSDSLVAWTNDASLDSFAVITQFASAYLAVSLTVGLPHRGAISVGELQKIDLPVNGNMSRNVLGTGLIRAHQLESSQDWSGALIDDRCLDELGMSRRAILLRGDLPIIEYDLKGIDRRQSPMDCGLVIDWPRCLAAFHPHREDAFVEVKFGAHKKKTDIESVRQKILNTQRFLNSRQGPGPNSA